MHYDLTLANASAWHWWTAVSHRPDSSALIHTTYNPNSDPDTHYKMDGATTILPTKTLWAFGNFSRFVRPTAQRVSITITGQGQITSLMLSNPAHDPGNSLLASAYLNQDSKAPNKLVIVLVNRGGDIRITKDQQICNDIGMPFLAYYVTSAMDDLKYYAIKQDRGWMVPAQSVVTIVTGP